MTVCNTRIFNSENRGASITEVVLAMAIVGMATPFVYSQIANTNRQLKDVTVAKRIIAVRDDVLNFVRMNQDKWPDNAQIQMTEEDLAQIKTDAAAGFIDKYAVNGATITDVYLAFPVANKELQATNIANHIGGDAAIVRDDGVAYGNTWAVTAPDFMVGDLIYRITRNVSGEDTSKYLHRATSGEDNWNTMERDLDTNGHHIYNVATIDADAVKARNVTTPFVNATNATTENTFFRAGANIDGTNTSINNIRVTGDMSGFKNINTTNLNGAAHTTQGNIITERATITDEINVANDLILKTDSTRTISGFTGINTHSVLTPFISANEMIFYENFGLTISGELLVSTTPPLKIGDWVFPSTKPPMFSKFNLSRGKIPNKINASDVGEIMKNGWQQTTIQTTPVQISTID